MLNLYATARGDLAPAHTLTDEEALALFESGTLEARHIHDLSDSARAAVLGRIKSFDVASTRTSKGTVVVWGLRKGDPRTVLVAEGTH